MGSFGVFVVLASVVAFILGIWMHSAVPGKEPASDPAPTPELTAIIEHKEVTSTASARGKSPAALKADAKAAMGELASLDPQAALKKVDTLRLPSGTRERLYGHVFSVWSKSDPDAASAFATSVEDPLRRAVALEGVATGWVTVDVEAAMDWASGLSGNRLHRERALAVVLVSGSEVDARGTAELAVNLKPEDLLALANRPKRHFPPLTRVFQPLGKEDPVRTFKLFEEMPIEALARIFSFYSAWTPFRELFATDADAALRIAELFPEGSKARDAAISDVALAFTHSNVPRALELAELLSPSRKKFIVEQSVSRWDDQAAAMRLLLSEPEYRSRSHLERCMQRLASRDDSGADEALAILEEIPIRDREHVRASTLAGIAEHDPARAMSLTSGLDDKGRAQWGVVEAWAAADGDGFRAWLDSAQAEVRPVGLAAIGAALIGDDPQAAAAYLAEAVQTGADQLEASGIHEPYRDLADVLLKKDLGEAIEWLKSLGGAEVSAPAARLIARRALTVDVPGVHRSGSPSCRLER
jgi:hypothetical protein